MSFRTIAAIAAVATLAVGAVGVAAAQDRTGWPSNMTIGTASQGGTYFV